MSAPRPKLTRRRGACKECRLRKVRCDGAKPCYHCQRNETVCEYSIYRSRRYIQEKGIQSRSEHASTPTQPCATTNGSTTPDSSNQNQFSEIVFSPNTTGSANALHTPFSEACFSQLISDSGHSFLDFDFPDETIVEGTSQAKNTELAYQASGLQSQIAGDGSRRSMTMLNWRELSYDEHLHQHNTAYPYGLLGTEADSGSTILTLALLSERTVDDKAETKPFLGRKTCDLTALFKSADRGSRRQQAVSAKVEVLLSSRHQPCISDLLRKVGSGGENQSLDLTSLPVEKLILQAFKELGGLNLFIRERDVMRIQERVFAPEKLPIDVSDMSLLITSLACGALLDPEVSSVSRTALLDAATEASKLLLRQDNSVRQLMALVAGLYLAEKTGSETLPALILGSITTVVFLDLYSEPGLKTIQAKHAMQVLYCIDKSYALRWQTFSLVGDGSLPTMNEPDNTRQNDILSASSSQLLWNRLKYSKICSNILQLRVEAEEKPSKDRLDRAMALSTALEEWHKSFDYMMLSLQNSDVMRIKLRTFYQYQEARFYLTSIILPDLQSSSPAAYKVWRKLLKLSVKETITSFSTISSEYLLQDCNYLFINTLALCLLALEIVLESDQDCENENRALLSIVGGFFARIGIELPQTSIFREVSSLLEILAYS